MIVYKSRFLTRGEVWFDDPPGRNSVDWIIYNHRSKPVRRARTKPFHTLLIDLTASPDELLAQMGKDTVYKIKRARDKDNVTWKFPTAPPGTLLGAPIDISPGVTCSAPKRAASKTLILVVGIPEAPTKN